MKNTNTLERSASDISYHLGQINAKLDHAEARHFKQMERLVNAIHNK